MPREGRPKRFVLAAALLGVASAAACSGGASNEGDAAASTTTTTGVITTTTAEATTTTAVITTTTAEATTTTVAITTTTTPPTTTSPPPDSAPPAGPVVLPPLDPGEVLARGTNSEHVLALQQKLVELHFDPGPIDGEFGTKTTQAVWAFQHLNGLAADGQVGPELWQLLATAPAPEPLRPDGGPDRVEISIDQQVLRVYQGGALMLATHISTGTGMDYCDNGLCGTAITPTGDFTFLRRIDGWHTAPLGELYNPVYFDGGYAVHGSRSVPDHPASHGCVRIPMHIAEYFPDLVTNGEPVFVV